MNGTNTIHFISHSAVLHGCTVMYGCNVVGYQPQKLEPNCTRLKICGNQIDYPWEVATPTDNLTMAKLLFNSTISTPGAQFFGIDVNFFYLNTPHYCFEYMQLPLNLIPEEISLIYKIHCIADDVWVYIEIQKGMYGLPQVRLLGNKLLTQWLATRGF